MTKCEYPTDLSDAQWKFLQRFIPPACSRGRKIVYPRRDILNAIFYLLRTGCQWRMLPREFPPWKTVYQIFYRWRLSGIWEQIHEALRECVRRKAGRKPQPTAAVIDSQTVKTTEVGGPKGYDAGKKINGRKRHIVVDTLGLLLAVVVHSADQQDHSGACLVLYALWEKLKRIRVIFADTAYGRKGLPEFVRSTLGFTIELVRKARGVVGFEVIRQRWIVERTFAWINRCRRHSKDYERNPDTSETLIHIAMIHLMIKRLHPGDS